MPELAPGEWEHLFEPWFGDTPGTAPRPAERHDGPPETSLFREASQPLAVSRSAYVHRQSPVSRTLDLRTSKVTTEVERLVAYAERRHFGVEADARGRSEREELRDMPLPRLMPPPLDLSATGITPAAYPDRSAKARQSPNLPAPGSFRALIAFAAIALVAAYVVYVQRSAASAFSKAAAAERTAAETRRTAEEAISSSSDRAQRAIADALTQASRAARMIEVIAAPDARRIELAGRAAAPAAVGQALYSRSRGVIVSATDMPRPMEGHTFQVWATTSTGSVSLGLATPDAQGRVAVAFDLPPGLAGAIRGFVVTQERVGGNSSPAGATVLSN